MDIDAFRKLIDAYGTVESNWPAASRAEARSLVETEPAARDLLASRRELDNALDRYEVDVDLGRIRRNILAKLPVSESLPDRLIRWLIPESVAPTVLWRPVLAATLPLVIGIVLGSNISLDAEQPDSWEDEIYLLSLASDETEPLP